MINGTPYGYFMGKKGIRQGNPISLYLFVLVMMSFMQIVQKSVKDGNFKLQYKCEEFHITRLSFVEDVLAFMNGDQRTVVPFRDNLEVFKKCSVLEVNIDKS